MKITIDVPVNTLGLSVTVIYGDASGVLMDTKMLGKNEIDEQTTVECDNVCKSINTEEGEVNKWIPCVEGFPENGKLVLMTYTDYDNPSKRSVAVVTNLSEWTRAYYGAVAWMPMPEPYEGEFEGKDE